MSGVYQAVEMAALKGGQRVAQMAPCSVASMDMQRVEMLDIYMVVKMAMKMVETMAETMEMKRDVAKVMLTAGNLAHR